MGPLADAAGAARRALSGCSDLERALARLASSTVQGAEGRDAAHVVLYEDAAKRRVKVRGEEIGSTICMMLYRVSMHGGHAATTIIG